MYFCLLCIVNSALGQRVAGIKSRILWTADAASGAHRQPIKCSHWCPDSEYSEYCAVGAAAKGHLLRQRSECWVCLCWGKQPYNKNINSWDLTVHSTPLHSIPLLSFPFPSLSRIWRSANGWPATLRHSTNTSCSRRSVAKSPSC